MHTTKKINEKTTVPFGKQGQVALNKHYIRHHLSTVTWQCQGLRALCSLSHTRIVCYYSIVYFFISSISLLIHSMSVFLVWMCLLS